jgi:hypothetical protein
MLITSCGAKVFSVTGIPVSFSAVNIMCRLSDSSANRHTIAPRHFFLSSYSRPVRGGLHATAFFSFGCAVCSFFSAMIFFLFSVFLFRMVFFSFRAVVFFPGFFSAHAFFF